MGIILGKFLCISCIYWSKNTQRTKLVNRPLICFIFQDILTSFVVHLRNVSCIRRTFTSSCFSEVVSSVVTFTLSRNWNAPNNFKYILSQSWFLRVPTNAYKAMICYIIIIFSYTIFLRFRHQKVLCLVEHLRQVLDFCAERKQIYGLL